MTRWVIGDHVGSGKHQQDAGWAGVGGGRGSPSPLSILLQKVRRREYASPKEDVETKLALTHPGSFSAMLL